MNENVKSFIDVAHTSVRGVEGDDIGAVFQCRRVGSRTLAVMVGGAECGVSGSVEATTVASMFMEFLSMGTHHLVAARSVLESFGGGVSFVVVDLEQGGDMLVVEYSEEQKTGRFSNAVILQQGGVCRNKLTRQDISVDVSSGDVYKVSCLRHKLEIDDMVLLSSAFAPDVRIAHLALDGHLARFYTGPHEGSLYESLRVFTTPTASVGDDYPQEVMVAALHRRIPRRILFCSGPPFNDNNDAKLCATVESWSGSTIISGGTTAQIISRGLGREINVNLRRDVSGLPPTSSMEGVDLITEGVLTLARLYNLLERSVTLELTGKGIDYDVARMLLLHDEISFLVGTSINVVHQDPNLPMELELRRNVIKSIARILELKFLKRVKISYL